MGGIKNYSALVMSPTASTFHLTPRSIHVSCLKKKLGEQVLPQQHLPDITSAGKVHIQPAAILDCRLVKHHNQAAVEVLIRWAHMPPEDATWEPYETIKERFPDFLDTQP
jgi:hypothetical protein